MNMKKLLATGLIASVAFATAESSASCGNGGFYVQGSFGLSTTKMKYKNNLDPQYNVLIAEEVEKMQISDLYYQHNQPDQQALGSVYKFASLSSYTANTNATKTSFNKRKSLFQGELGFGYYKEFGSEFVIGLSLNVGKNFGNVKKKEMGVALARNYMKLSHDLVEYAGAGDFDGADGLVVKRHASPPYSDERISIVGGEAIVALAKFGGDVLLYQRDLELELKCKNKYYVSIMPRFGILVNPKLELFVAAGVKIKSDKYTMYVPSLKKSAKKTVTKCIPVVQVGLQYNFHSGMFANLSYTFNFKAKKTFKFKANNQINMDSTVKHTLQNSSHDIKLGFGYRF